MQNQVKIDVYLFSKERNYFANVEEARLRRNLKNGLELNNVKYINSPIDENIKIVHFLNFEDYNKFNYFKNKTIIKAVSVLSTESDSKGRLFNRIKNKESKDFEYHISKKDLNILNSFDYVLAPSEEAKKLLLDEGVISKVEVLNPSVKLSKLKLDQTEIANIVYIYFHFEENSKYFLIPLDYTDIEAAKKILNLASIFKNYRFIVYSQDLNLKEAKSVKKIFKKHPWNIIIANNLEEDVYYSMLYRSSGVILLNEVPLFLLELMEAFAAKKPVLALKNSVFQDMAIDKINSHVYNDFASLIKGINELILGELVDLSTNEYKFASENRIQVVGEKLAELYKRMLKEKENV